MASSLAGLALAELFDLAVEKGKPILTEEALRQVRTVIEDRRDNVIANDARDGWTNTQAADPKNDYPGDALAKRIDNFFFLYAKSLPGKATDVFRDLLSADLTPALRAQVDESATPERLADLVGNAIYGEAEKLAGRVG